MQIQKRDKLSCPIKTPLRLRRGERGGCSLICGVALVLLYSFNQAKRTKVELVEWKSSVEYLCSSKVWMNIDIKSLFLMIEGVYPTNKGLENLT